MTIGDSVTSIGVEAFLGCSSLTSVTIGNSVISIGNQAFNGCSSLTNVTIPDSVTSIQSETFDGCSSLTSITIPDSVTYIGQIAFARCFSLTSITFEGDAPLFVLSNAFWVSSNAKVIVNPNATGYGKTFVGIPVEILEKPLTITSSQLDFNGNFIILAEGITDGIKVMHTSNFKSKFKEVSTATKQGDNQFLIPASAPELQGSQGFFILQKN